MDESLVNTVVCADALTDVWSFGSDLPARRRFFEPEVFSHPAKLHLGLLQRLIDLYTEPGQTILDPMAGTGSLMLAATQMRNVILRDIEPEYVAMIEHSLPKIREQAGLFTGLIDVGQADARTLECAPYDHVIMSPPYGFPTGCGLSDDRRQRILQSVSHGRRWLQYLTSEHQASIATGFRYTGGPSNAGNKSGRNYWRDMEAIYERCVMFLPPQGKLIVILKNHYRRGKLIDITEKTLDYLVSLGLRLINRHGRTITNLSLWQRRRKEQGLPVVEVEDVLVFGFPFPSPGAPAPAQLALFDEVIEAQKA